MLNDTQDMQKMKHFHHVHLNEKARWSTQELMLGANTAQYIKLRL